MKLKRIIYIGLALIVAFFVMRMMSRGGDGSKKVTFAKVGKLGITETVGASGKVHAVNEIRISSEVSGEIIQLTVKDGDQVKAGQLLAKIRPNNLESIVERSEATLKAQKANLHQSKSRMEQANSRLLQSQADEKRYKGLFDKKMISESEYDTYNTNLKVAQSEYNAAVQAVEAAKFTIESAEASLREAKENLKLTSIYAPVSGTITKLSVEEGEKVVGTSQMAGTEILRVANLEAMEVRVDVNENDIVHIDLGDTAEVEVEAYTREQEVFKGIVTSIANTANEGALASADAVTEFEVKILILNTSYKHLLDRKKTSPFRPGMTANVEIITNTKEGIVAVPLSAVTTRTKKQLKDMKRSKDRKKDAEGDDKENDDELDAPSKDDDELVEIVFIRTEDNKAKHQVVNTGISNTDYIEIKSGVEEGQVVISGPFAQVSRHLKDGDKVVKMKSRRNRRK